ncbi:MAG: hypothetical protein WC825_10110, partial [Gallionellaceae bacterium]
AALRLGRLVRDEWLEKFSWVGIIRGRVEQCQCHAAKTNGQDSRPARLTALRRIDHFRQLVTPVEAAFVVGEYAFAL